MSTTCEIYDLGQCTSLVFCLSFPICIIMINTGTYPIGWLELLRELMHVKCLTQKH